MDDWEDIADDWEQHLNEDDDDAPDNWDDEEDDEGEDPFATVTVQKDTPKSTTPGAAAGTKKKKKIKVKAIKKKQLAKKLGSVTVDPVAEKQRQLELQRESDLQNASDLLSVEGVIETTAPTVASFTPTTKLEFLKYSSMLVEDLSKFQDSEHYITFVTDLVRKLSGSLNSDQVNEITSTLNVIKTQKIQEERGKKKKQTKTKSFND